MRPFRAALWLLAPVVGSSAGLAYGLTFDVDLVICAIRGTCIGTPLVLYERGFLLRRWRGLTRRTSTPLFALATFATYTVMILVGHAAAGVVLHHGLGYLADLDEAVTISAYSFAYALVVTALVTFVFRVRDLMGARVFASLLAGRYHRPISEERVFLFLDVAGSTRFAEAHGARAAQRYLGAVFDALAPAVRRSHGSIDDYIGDMAMVSWPIDRGMQQSACLHCVFAFAHTIEAASERWLARFGQVPTFRAALHCGRVVTAEIGLDRRKIAYFGDVLNTTSRLEGLAKELGVQVLVSGDLLDNLRDVPSYIVVDDLGERPVRGRMGLLRIAAVSGPHVPRPTGDDVHRRRCNSLPRA